MVRDRPITVIRAEHLGMCFGVRDAIALALRRADAAPLTILGDLVHNDDGLAALRAKGIATAEQPAQVTTQTVMVTAHGASERALATHPRARPGDRRGDLSARARGASGGQGARPRRLSPCHHRPARSCRGAGADRRSRRLRRRARRGATCWRSTGTSAHGHRRADDAADREGAAPGRADSAAVPAIRRPLHRHRLPPDQSSARTPPSSWRAVPTSSSSSAARPATTRASS